MNRLKAIGLSLASCVIVVTVAAAMVSTNMSVSAAPAAAPPITRQQVLDAARQMQTIAVRIDRIEAKLTTWRDILAARQATNDYIAALKPDQQLWVVAMAGTFRPQLSPQQFRWGIFIYDATTGARVATYAGDEPWPILFPRLRDQAP